jgi:FkbM family methyltransferase
MESPSPSPARFSAQTGEDRKLFEHLMGSHNGFYVEVGAFDGVEMSNSHYFEQIGWRGLLVEADPHLANECRRNRPRAVVSNCAAVAPGAPPHVTFQVASDNRGLSSLALDDASRSMLKSWTGRVNIQEITVPAKPLSAILAENGVGSIDFMTIDVEGHEWSVLRGLPLRRWRPRILILERNGRWPDRRIFNHLQRSGYRYLDRTGVNDWYEFVGRERLSLTQRCRSIAAIYGPVIRDLVVKLANRCFGARPRWSYRGRLAMIAP